MVRCDSESHSFFEWQLCANSITHSLDPGTINVTVVRGLQYYMQYGLSRSGFKFLLLFVRIELD